MMNEKNRIQIYLLILLSISCTFDYGDQGEKEDILPDMVMEDASWARVRGGEMQAKFTASRIERWEKRNRMNIFNVEFEQYYEEDWERKVNSSGEAGVAEINLSTMDIKMDGGCLIDVVVEGMVIEAQSFEWDEGAKKLTSGNTSQVTVSREDGSILYGVGFSADLAYRTYLFESGVYGVLVEEDEEEDELAGGEFWEPPLGGPMRD